MIFDNIEIHASPFISKAICPKCKNRMKEYLNGWLSDFYYCETCKKPFVIGFVKIKKYDINKLNEIIKKKKPQNVNP